MTRTLKTLLNAMDRLGALHDQDTQLTYLKYPPKGLEDEYQTPGNIDQLCRDNILAQQVVNKEIERLFNEITG